MRPEDAVGQTDEPDSWEQPCCRMMHHHLRNNPICGTRIPLDLHICHARMSDYMTLQIGGQFDIVDGQISEGYEVEEAFTDDLPEDLSPDNDAYASSFERCFNLMRRNRQHRRAVDRMKRLVKRCTEEASAMEFG